MIQDDLTCHSHTWRTSEHGTHITIISQTEKSNVIHLLAPPPAISLFSNELTLMESTILSSLVVFGFVEAVVLAGEQNIKCHRL